MVLRAAPDEGLAGEYLNGINLCGRSGAVMPLAQVALLAQRGEVRTHRAGFGPSCADVLRGRRRQLGHTPPRAVRTLHVAASLSDGSADRFVVVDDGSAACGHPLRSDQGPLPVPLLHMR